VLARANNRAISLAVLGKRVGATTVGCCGQRIMITCGMSGGLAVAGSEAAGRKSPHNHAQTARNLRRSLRNAVAGARLIQPEGLDSKSATEVEATLADALEELHRLRRGLDRRIRRD
jgi:hypothetical protein